MKRIFTTLFAFMVLMIMIKSNATTVTMHKRPIEITRISSNKEVIQTVHYNKFIDKATKHNIDPKLLMSICYVESTFKPNVINKKSGASGMCQLLPRYHKLDNYLDVNSNIDKASEYLSELTDLCNGDNYCIINSYNVGYYGYKNKGKKNTHYYNKVMNYYNNYDFSTVEEET